MDEAEPGLAERTADVVSAYVANNALHISQLPELIVSVHAASKRLSAPGPIEAERPEPPVPIKKSVTPDFLISLEDGRQYKSLKRHLTGRGLTPDQYRERWGLPRDYPMVAPNYAKQRSELAKALGLGRFRGQSLEPSPDLSSSPDESAPTPKRRPGRPREPEVG
jgi:predicted transcriptional regulator